MGIFDQEVDLWNYYRVRLQFRDKLMGGTPKNPDIIEGWLRTHLGISNSEEIRQATLKTLEELGHEVSPEMTYEEVLEATKKLAGTKSTNGFKVDPLLGLVVEGRQIKAAIKESVNIQFAGTRWGVTRKAPKGYVAERVFVLEDKVAIGRPEPDGIDLVIGHVPSPQGPRSTLAYHEYAMRPEITFYLMESKVLVKGKEGEKATTLYATDDRPPSLTREQWAIVWVTMQEQGIGALRSQSHGRFDITAFDKIPASEAPKPSAVTEQAMAEAIG